MGNAQMQARRLHTQRERIAKDLHVPDMIRGTMLKRYLECTRAQCTCHKSVEKRHGPYYFLVIRKKSRTKHVYVPHHMAKTVKQWVSHYNDVWHGIEQITDINVQLIRLSSK